MARSRRFATTLAKLFAGFIAMLLLPTNPVAALVDPAVARGKSVLEDLTLISESVDAIDVGIKYRDTALPLIPFENDRNERNSP
jgi:hypothetical protein